MALAGKILAKKTFSNSKLGVSAFVDKKPKCFKTIMIYVIHCTEHPWCKWSVALVPDAHCSAGVSLPPRLCTWLPGLRSSARVTPQRTSTTALFDYISAGRSTHCAFYHWRPHLSSDCCIGLEQSAGVGPVVSVVASFPQQTENRTFCLVLQSCLTTSHCTDYTFTWLHCLGLLLRVLAVLGLNAKIKLIRPSSSSSSSSTTTHLSMIRSTFCMLKQISKVYINRFFCAYILRDPDQCCVTQCTQCPKKISWTFSIVA